MTSWILKKKKEKRMRTKKILLLQKGRIESYSFEIAARNETFENVFNFFFLDAFSILNNLDQVKLQLHSSKERREIRQTELRSLFLFRYISYLHHPRKRWQNDERKEETHVSY